MTIRIVKFNKLYQLTQFIKNILKQFIKLDGYYI